MPPVALGVALAKAFRQSVVTHFALVRFAPFSEVFGSSGLGVLSLLAFDVVGKQKRHPVGDGALWAFSYVAFWGATAELIEVQEWRCARSRAGIMRGNLKRVCQVCTSAPQNARRGFEVVLKRGAVGEWHGEASHIAPLGEDFAKHRARFRERFRPALDVAFADDVDRGVPWMDNAPPAVAPF